MGELIDMRVHFKLRRIRTEVRRAEREYAGFHERFAEMLKEDIYLCKEQGDLQGFRTVARFCADHDIILPPKPEEG